MYFWQRFILRLFSVMNNIIFSSKYSLGLIKVLTFHYQVELKCLRLLCNMISQSKLTGKQLCWSVVFNKLRWLQLATLLKARHQLFKDLIFQMLLASAYFQNYAACSKNVGCIHFLLSKTCAVLAKFQFFLNIFLKKHW